MELKSICRLCLKNGEFESIFYVENDIHYAQKVMTCTTIEISPDDALPLLICYICIGNLNISYNFKKQCELSDLQLKNLICENKHTPNVSPKELKTWVDVEIGNVDIKLEDHHIFDSGDFSNSDDDEKFDGLPLLQRKKKVTEKKAKGCDEKESLKLDSPMESKPGETEIYQTHSVSTKPRLKNRNSHKKLRKKLKSSNAQPKYQCSDCPKKFNFKNEMIIHVRRHTGERPWECQDCDKSFICVTDLKRHQTSVHAKVMRYSCAVCGRHFALAGGLKTHMRIHTGEKPYQCTECGARFSQPGSLRTHKLRHSGEHPFVCDTCGGAFTTHGGLARHKRTHTGEKRAQCTICGKKFVSVSYLPEHMRSHTGEKPFECKECGKCFSLNGNLAIHARTHALEGEHVCPECGKACTDLKAHMRRHTGDRPYACPHCDKKFKQSSSLKYHITIHTNERKYSCEICSKTYKTNEALKEHTTLHTGERPHECEVCEQTFRSVSNKRKHVKRYHTAPNSKQDKIMKPKKPAKKIKRDVLNTQNLLKTVKHPELIKDRDN